MPKEIIIPKNSSPDTLLYSVLDFLRSLPLEERTAVVAGVHCYNTGEFLVATSHQFRDPDTNKLIWNHAEYEVLDDLPGSWKNDKGFVEPGSCLFISSLSPCVRPSVTRAHQSCTDLLVNSGFAGEYTGKIDNNAAKTGYYQELEFVASLTDDPILLAVCHDLYKFFIPYKKKGWNKQRVIREALGHLPTQIYFQVPIQLK